MEWASRRIRVVHIAPLQIDSLVQLNMLSMDEVVEERRDHTNRLHDCLVLLRILLPKHVQKRGEIECVALEPQIVTRLLSVPNARLPARVVKVINAQPAYSRKRIGEL